MTVFDFIRKRITEISDNLAAVDGKYPEWDIGSLNMLLDSLEKDWSEKKYKCTLSQDAEDETTGTMMLTREEYEIVKIVANYINWVDLRGGLWSGTFSIWCEELEDERPD